MTEWRRVTFGKPLRDDLQVLDVFIKRFSAAMSEVTKVGDWAYARLTRCSEMGICTIPCVTISILCNSDVSSEVLSKAYKLAAEGLMI